MTFSLEIFLKALLLMSKMDLYKYNDYYELDVNVIILPAMRSY